MMPAQEYPETPSQRRNRLVTTRMDAAVNRAAEVGAASVLLEPEEYAELLDYFEMFHGPLGLSPDNRVVPCFTWRGVPVRLVER